MKSPTVKHEDERRTLVEWVKDIPFKSAKIVIAKNDLPLGEHYHNNKDEVFYLLKGNGTMKLDGVENKFTEGDCIFVKRGTMHTFILTAGSILLGVGTEPFDPNDEIQNIK